MRKYMHSFSATTVSVGSANPTVAIGVLARPLLM